jgi:hypothetical protein
MTTFVNSSANQSGVTMTQMQPLADKLATAAGDLSAGGGTTTGMMSGTATMGPVSGATVAAYAVAGGAMGAQVGSALTDGTGNFSVALGTYAGTVMLQLTGGSFVDPATGTTMTMQAGDVLTSCVPSVLAGSTTTGVQLTPLTSMAQARAQHLSGGMNAANVAAANTAVGHYFMVGDILTTPPMNPTVAGSGAAATQDARDYGMSIAAMSEYAKTVGMSVSSSGIVSAMMKDATDGVMNGMMGSTTIAMSGMGGMMGGGTMMQANAGTTGLATAMSTFVASGMNRSGLMASDMKALVDELTASTGTIQ